MYIFSLHRPIFPVLFLYFNSKKDKCFLEAFVQLLMLSACTINGNMKHALATEFDYTNLLAML